MSADAAMTRDVYVPQSINLQLAAFDAELRAIRTSFLTWRVDDTDREHRSSDVEAAVLFFADAHDRALAECQRLERMGGAA